MNPITLRLLSQQLLSPQFSKPEEVVAHFGAMQAQDIRMVRWAVSMRTRKPSAKSFEEAINQGRIIRMHLMRGTWQLVAAEDYWWMLDLCGERAHKVIKGWQDSSGIVFSDEEHRAVLDVIEQVTKEKRSATKEDYALALADNGFNFDEHRLNCHIRRAELDAVLCSGDFLPMKPTYALVEQKIPRIMSISHDEALKRLAIRYFQSHSPATLNDFAWWSGLTMGDCKKAVAMLADCLKPFPDDNHQFLLLDSCRTRKNSKPSRILLPAYDEYLIGYKSRDLVLAPEVKHKAHNNSGIFHPVIVSDGVVCANWKPYEKNLTATPFPNYSLPDSLDEAWNDYSVYLQR